MTIDLTKYRIVDLSYEIVPGERKIDGRYLHGQPRSGRPIEVQEFIAYTGRMHFIQGQTHTGAHAEAPYKYFETAVDMALNAGRAIFGRSRGMQLYSQKGGGNP